MQFAVYEENAAAILFSNQSINQSINQCLFAPLIQKINLQKAQSSQKPLMFLQEGPLTKHCFPRTGRWLNKI